MKSILAAATLASALLQLPRLAAAQRDPYYDDPSLTDDGGDDPFFFGDDFPTDVPDFSDLGGALTSLLADLSTELGPLASQLCAYDPFCSEDIAALTEGGGGRFSDVGAYTGFGFPTRTDDTGASTYVTGPTKVLGTGRPHFSGTFASATGNAGFSTMTSAATTGGVVAGSNTATASQSSSTGAAPQNGALNAQAGVVGGLVMLLGFL